MVEKQKVMAGVSRGEICHKIMLNLNAYLVASYIYIENYRKKPSLRGMFWLIISNSNLFCREIYHYLVKSLLSTVTWNLQIL